MILNTITLHVNGEKSSCLLIIYEYIEVYISTRVIVMTHIASATNHFSLQHGAWIVWLINALGITQAVIK